MSQGYILTPTGQVIIENLFLDELGVEQTLDNNFLKGDASLQQIFFTVGIPMWPILITVSGTRHPRLFEAIDQRVFEATDNRVFEV